MIFVNQKNTDPDIGQPKNTDTDICQPRDTRTDTRTIHKKCVRRSGRGKKPLRRRVWKFILKRSTEVVGRRLVGLVLIGRFNFKTQTCVWFGRGLNAMSSKLGMTDAFKLD